MAKLTKEQFEKINKTFQLLTRCNTRVKRERIGLRTLAMLDNAIYALQNIYIDGESTTLCFEIACFFKKQGFEIVDCWIGWTIRV